MIILESKTLNGDEKRFLLRPGQSARVGRTEWADWAFPNDQRLADIHFMVACEGDAWRLNDLSGGATLLNREPVVDACLKTGDRIHAGDTSFRVEIDRQPSTAETIQPIAMESVNSPITVDPIGASGPIKRSRIETPLSIIASWAEPELEATLMPPQNQNVLQWIDHIMESSTPAPSHANQFNIDSSKGTPDDSRMVTVLRILSYTLTTRRGVLWACDCIESLDGDSLSAQQETALKSARSWADAPSLESRRMAMQAVEAFGKQRNACAWVAVAAAWSSGPSMESEKENLDDCQEEVFIEANHLTSAAALAGAVTLAGVEVPEETSNRYLQMIKLGRAAIDDTC